MVTPNTSPCVLFGIVCALGCACNCSFNNPEETSDQGLSCLQGKNASDKQQIQEAAWGQQAFGAEKIYLEMAERGEHGGGER